jgi:hypothetical protein
VKINTLIAIAKRFLRSPKEKAAVVLPTELADKFNRVMK